MNNDADLLDLYVRSGSESAFVEIRRRHLSLVYSVALGLVRSPHLAEEVTQSVFINLAKEAPKLRTCSALRSWLHQVTRRLAVNAIRGESRRIHRHEIAAACNRSGQSDFAERDEILNEALARLSDSDRQIILLRYFENKNCRTIALELGVSAEAAQKRLSRALERLKDDYSRRGFRLGAAGMILALSWQAIKRIPSALHPSPGTFITAPVVNSVTKAMALNSTHKFLIGVAAAFALTAGVYVSSHTPSAPNGVEAPKEAPPRPLAAPIVHEVSAISAPEDDELQRMREENTALRQANTKLQSEKDRAVEKTSQAQISADLFREISKKLSDETLEAPRNFQEAAFIAGRLHSDLARFTVKWSKALPAEGTPEAEAYRKELEKLSTSTAVMMKSEEMDALVQGKGKTIGFDIEQYYSFSLAGALGLEGDQWRQVSTTLSRYYAEGKSRGLMDKAGLRVDAPPGLDDSMMQQRDELSLRAYNELQAHMTPAQQNDFRQLYSPGMLFEIAIGGPGEK